MLPPTPPSPEETRRARARLAGLRAEARRRRRRRRYARGGIAGAVVAMAAALGIWLVPSRPWSTVRLVSPPTTTTVSPPTTPPPTTPPPTTRTGPRRIGPWAATGVGGPAADGIPIAGDRRSLYVADGRAILRLDPATEAVLADQQHPAGDGPAMSLFRAGIDGGALWTSPTASGRVVTLHRLDLATLRPLATVTFPLPGRFSPEDLIAVSVNAPHDRLYVGAGHTVAVIDAATREVVHRYQLTGPAIGDIAVNPADTRLYVTQTTERDTTTLTALDPSTGRLIAKPAPLPNPGGVLAASSGGVWLLTGSGMTDDLEFAPASDPSHLRGPLTGAGGGFPVTSTPTANVVWLGGTSNVACADPLTGRIRATARVPAPGRDAANIADLTPAGNRLFARYQADNGPSNLLVTLEPPARCTPGG